MAKNGQRGHGRIGPIKQRTQMLNPHNNRWVERDAKTGLFVNVKADKKPFKGIRKEKHNGRA
jgi:hypothetical protein